VLLRGLNVNGHRPTPMAELRVALEAAGFAGVRTYLQTGNVFLDSPAGPDEVRRAVETTVCERFGWDVPAAVLEVGELVAVAADNPFADQDHPRNLYVAVLAGAADARLRALAREDVAPEALAVRGRVVYLRCTRGFHRSRLTVAFLEGRLGVPVTLRGWGTIQALARLAAAP
jgi:uncharacterized protein (DUF1697 family)